MYPTIDNRRFLFTHIYIYINIYCSICIERDRHIYICRYILSICLFICIHKNQIQPPSQNHHVGSFQSFARLIQLRGFEAEHIGTGCSWRYGCRCGSRAREYLVQIWCIYIYRYIYVYIYNYVNIYIYVIMWFLQ